MSEDDSTTICEPSDVDLFDHLPVLAIRTATTEGTQIIEACNDRLARRLSYARSDLIGKPVKAAYAAGATPPTVASKTEDLPDDQSHGSVNDPDRLSIGSGDEADRSTALDEGGPREEPRPFAPRARGRDHHNSADSMRSKPYTDGRVESSAPSAVGERQHHAEADAAAEQPVSGSTCTLVSSAGHLIQTVAEAIPRTDGTDGHVIFHVDVTRQEHRAKQAKVLNRVMRHNVRNDLNLLRGHAKVLQKHDDDEVVDSAEVLDRIADRWLGLADTVRTIERLFDEISTETATIEDVVVSVRRTIEHEWSDGSVETVCEADPAARVSERLHVVLVELCENGIKHADSSDAGEEPVVRIEITPSRVRGWIVIHVADEGPGIPQQELNALHAPTETPLQHGSGLGFWLIRFVVRRLGGEIAAENRDGDGSIVSIHIPLADDDCVATKSVDDDR